MEHDPHIINALDRAPEWRAWDPTYVRKIVLGKIEGEPQDIEGWNLQEELGKGFSSLTHLHLWGLKGLRTLPALPASLTCLDVRKCPDLETLPALPGELDTLDVANCPALQGLPRAVLPQLARLYLGGCTSLDPDDLEAFLRANADAPLEELEAPECPAFTKLKNVPGAKLRRLVLAGCEDFADAGGIERFVCLDHVDLSGCVALEKLPDLPSSVRYVLLHGARSLQHFLDQDIGDYDRGAEKQNVVSNLRSRQKFGKELGVSAHAKLLLMGDGRVGKTTLAKRLIWDTLSAAKRAEHPVWEPHDGEPFTENVRYWNWETKLRLDSEKVASLNERAESRGLGSVCDGEGAIDGTVRILDFGGQEVYHHTHRIFASQGAVFLLVWRADEPTREETMKGKPYGVSEEVWLEWNRRRSLEYWLEYVDSLRPDARVALVCTRCTGGSDRVAWESRVGRFAVRPGLECFYVDSLEQDCGRNEQYHKLLDWIRRECGKEASRIGVLQPRFFGEVAMGLEGMVQANDTARAAWDDAPYLWMDWPAWSAELHGRHRATKSALELDGSDVEAITAYLHEAGHLHRVAQRGAPAVLVDVAWATDLLYSLLKPGQRLTERIRGAGGWFPESVLQLSAEWRVLTETDRQQLVAYMEDCHIAARISSAGENGLGQELFFATEKWLLPTYAEVEARVDGLMEVVSAQPAMVSRERFRFEEKPITEFAFRALLAYLAGSFGRQAIWFRNGLVATDRDRDPRWCIRVRWNTPSPDDLMGTLDAVLITRKDRAEEMVAWLEGLLADEKCPIPELRKPRRAAVEVDDLSHAFFRPSHGAEYDVAFSSSGQDKEIAEQIAVALKAEFERTWYQDDTCRAGDYEALLAYMKSLARPPVIVLLVSDGYLSDDIERRWYCLWELADAVNRQASGARKPAQTIVVYAPDQKVSSRNLDDVAALLFQQAADHFWELYRAKDAQVSGGFDYYNELKEHFLQASTNLPAFFKEHGNLGSYPRLLRSQDGSVVLDELLERVRRGLDGLGRPMPRGGKP